MTNITILNIKSIDKTDYAFCSWRCAQPDFNINDYRVVYTGCTKNRMLCDDDYTDVCEALFARTNVPGADALDDFFGHSMSVSDVVIISSIDGMRAYYCDTFDWEKIDSLCTVGFNGL